MLEKLKDERVFTISNLMSLSRVFLLLPVIYFFKQDTPESKFYLFGLMLLAMLSDYLDGILARKLNQVSNLGKILDPVADKICMGVMAILLVQYRDMPLWFVIVIVARDVIILFCALFVLDKKNQIMQSTMPGKFAVGFMSISVLAYTFDIHELKLISIILSMIFILWTMVVYATRFIHVLHQKKPRLT